MFYLRHLKDLSFIHTKYGVWYLKKILEYILEAQKKQGDQENTKDNEIYILLKWFGKENKTIDQMINSTRHEFNDLTFE